MQIGAHFSKIVVIESLDQEFRSGTLLYDYLSTLGPDGTSVLPIELVQCQSATHFQEIVAGLVEEARASDEIPVLHVECHGLTAKNGIAFCDSSMLLWPAVTPLLHELNVATRFNLIAVFAACFGAHFLSQMQVVTEAPCCAMLGPADEIQSYDLLGSFRDFYRILIAISDIAAAVKAANNRGNDFMFIPADYWFRKLMAGYFETECTDIAMARRATRIADRLRREGYPAKNEDIFLLGKSHNRTVLDRNFNRFFMVKEIPENASRYGYICTEIRSEFSQHF